MAEKLGVEQVAETEMAENRGLERIARRTYQSE